MAYPFLRKIGVFINARIRRLHSPSPRFSYSSGETYLEVIKATSPASDPARWIAEKGQGLYHICLEVDDIDGALAELKAKGVKLLDEAPREGHANTRIAFLDPQSTADVLIELVEMPAAPVSGDVAGHAAE